MRVHESIATETSRKVSLLPGGVIRNVPESSFRWKKKSKVIVNLDMNLENVKKKIYCGNEITHGMFDRIQQSLFSQYYGKDWYDFHPILFAWHGGIVDQNQNTLKKLRDELTKLNVALPGPIVACNLFDMIAMALSNTAPMQILIAANDFSPLTLDSMSGETQWEWKIQSRSSGLIPFGNRISKPLIKKIMIGGDDMYVRSSGNYWYVAKFLPR